MDTAVKLVQVIAPLITVLVAVLGIRAWYWQLAAKRRFEIAEQAIHVFKRANDAISTLRNPMVWTGEGEKVEVPEDGSDEKKKLIKQYGYVFSRLERTNKPFEDVRLTQILAELHISKRAGECFEALFRVRHLTWVAAHMLVTDYDEYLPSDAAREQNLRRRKYTDDLWEIRSNDVPIAKDRLSRVLDEAKASLESECGRSLRPPTFWEFIVGASNKTTSQAWSDEARKVLLLPTN
jgi:hypothetical protein